MRDEQTVDAIKSAMHEVVIPACKDEIRRLLAEQSEAERAHMWTLFCKERYAVTVDKLTQALAILTEPAWVIPEQE